jgi:8-oxo-dGTP pyrophosphatase MutT (NUDIX family)
METRKNRIRAVALLIEKDRIAMIERQRLGETFYVFPGGGLHPDETPEQAVERETLEELGLEVRALRQVAETTYLDNPHLYFLVERIGGVFGAGTGKELSRPADSPRGSVTPIWLPLSRLAPASGLQIYPRKIADLVLEAQADGWPDEIVRFEETV